MYSNGFVVIDNVPLQRDAHEFLVAMGRARVTVIVAVQSVSMLSCGLRHIFEVVFAFGECIESERDRVRDLVCRNPGDGFLFTRVFRSLTATHHTCLVAELRQLAPFSYYIVKQPPNDVSVDEIDPSKSRAVDVFVAALAEVQRQAQLDRDENEKLKHFVALLEEKLNLVRKVVTLE